MVLYERDERYWMVARADHCWHAVDTYGYQQAALFEKSDLVVSPNLTPYGGGWREISRAVFDERVEEIAKGVKRSWDYLKTRFRETP